MRALIYVPVMVYLLSLGALMLCAVALVRGWGIPDDDDDDDHSGS